MFTDELIKIYFSLLPIAGYMFLAAFFITPIVGFLANKYHFIDLPAIRRKRTDKSLAQRIHKKTKPRLGGLSYLLPMLVLLIVESQYNHQMIGIAIGLSILIIVGALDDKYELPARTQLISQFFSGLVVVLFGAKILEINFAGIVLNFNLWSQTFNIGSIVFSIVFPADLITIFWILLIINAVNWMYGMDAIGEAMTIIAAITTALLSVRVGLLGYALVSFSLAGGLLGFLPFNIYPSKIIGGTAGATGNGYLLAVLSILSGSKFNNAIMLILFPLFDMIWVIIYRIKTHKDQPFLKRPFISGKVHFHHRLMMLGLSQRKILIVETLLISSLSIFGLFMSGFSDTFLFSTISFFALIVVFSLVSYFVNKKEKLIAGNLKNVISKNKISNEIKPKDDIPPEERYAY